MDTKNPSNKSGRSSRRTRKSASRKKPALRDRIALNYQDLQHTARNPASIGPRVKSFMLTLWQSRGGGFYGLGYVITFLALEVSMFFGDVGESDGVSDFISSQIMSLMFKFAFESIINSFLALIWPALLIGKWGQTGIIILVVSFFLFQWAVKPRLDSLLGTTMTNRNGQ